MLKRGMTMPFGKYRNTLMTKVPAGYLLYLYDKGLDEGTVRNWIENNKKDLKERLKEEEKYKIMINFMELSFDNIATILYSRGEVIVDVKCNDINLLKSKIASKYGKIWIKGESIEHQEIKRTKPSELNCFISGSNEQVKTYLFKLDTIIDL